MDDGKKRGAVRHADEKGAAKRVAVAEQTAGREQSVGLEKRLLLTLSARKNGAKPVRRGGGF